MKTKTLPPLRRTLNHPRPRADTVIFIEPMNGQAIKVPESAHTYPGFLDWCLSGEFPEQGRITYLNGIVYLDLTMEEIEAHNKIKSVVTRVVGEICDEEDLGEFYSDGVRIANAEGEVSNEPDASFCSWETLETKRAVVLPLREDGEKLMVIEGTPDWVVEIVSDSSVTKDKRDLRNNYHRAHIPEYWLIDARNKIEFLILLWTRTGYQEASAQNGWQKSTVFGRQFRLTRSKNRVGRWRYRLESRS